MLLEDGLKTIILQCTFRICQNWQRQLEEIMEYTGPVFQKDIEEAQRKIISIINHLCDIGEIDETGVDRFPDDIITRIEDA